MLGERSDDLSFVVSSVFMKMTGLWRAENRIEKLSRDFAAFYTIFTMSLFVFVQSTEFMRGGLDFAAVMYTLVGILSVGNGLFKTLVVFIYKKEFLRLVDHLQLQFMESHYDNNERTILDACKHTCAIFIVSFAVVTHVTAVFYISTPLIASVGKNETDRLHPFKLWPVFSLTPYYEMTYFVQALLIYQSSVCYFCFDNMLCMMSLHVTTQFRILQYRLTNLKSGNVDEDSDTGLAKDSYITFKKYVRQHQSLIAFCNKLEYVFSPQVLSQMLVCSMVICMNGLQALMETSVAGRRFIFLFFLLTTFIQLWVLTYSCDGLIQESTNVATAIYSSPWICMPMTKYGEMLRKEVVLVIARCKVPCCITAKGFFPISLETYTKVWSTAASYFTLLKQTMGDVENS